MNILNLYTRVGRKIGLDVFSLFHTTIASENPIEIVLNNDFDKLWE